MHSQKNSKFDTFLELFAITSLFGVMFAFELYGGILVAILFGGFVYFVGKSRKYEIVNNFIDSFYDN